MREAARFAGIDRCIMEGPAARGFTPGHDRLIVRSSPDWAIFAIYAPFRRHGTARCIATFMVSKSAGMEKRRPTYDLDAVKQVLGSARTLAITTSALRDATALGFDRHGVSATILGLERRMFVKSMTTFADHRV